MAEAGTLHDAFLDELRDAYDAEKQLMKALAKMAKAASVPKLRGAFESHLEETRGHVDRLEQVFETLDEKVRGKHCDGIAGIIEEGKSVMEEDFDDDDDGCLPDRRRSARRALRDGRVRHAGRLGQRHGPCRSGRTAQETLEPRRRRPTKKLTALAEGGINQAASEGAMTGEDSEASEKSKAASSAKPKASGGSEPKGGAKKKNKKKTARR